MKRLFALLLSFSLLFVLAACGGSSPPEEPDASPQNTPEESPAPDAGKPADGEYTLFDCGIAEIALPSQYLDQLIVTTDFQAAQGWTPLLSVSEKASVEAALESFGDSEGFGFLFGFAALNQAAYEQLLCVDGSGVEIFAAKGEQYFAYTHPTDVQFFRSGGEIDIDSEEWKNWESLNEIGQTVKADLLERNHLTPHSTAEFYSRTYTWEGEHAYLQFPTGENQEIYTLVLSQPATQGAGGIWCVERWIDGYQNVYPWFPDSGISAADYYAGVQAQCDGGAHLELLAPAGAAAAFVKAYFGYDLPESGFTPVDAAAAGIT